MNSSLLVPALVVVGVTAMGAVFFGDMITGGSGTHQSDYAVNKTEMTHPGDVSANSEAAKATETMAREFTWDDDDSSNGDRDSLDTSVNKNESFVSADYSKEAPGEVFSSSNDKQSLGLSGVANGINNSTKVVAEGNEDSFNSSTDIKSVSKQVDSDLNSFFNLSEKSQSTVDVVERSTITTPKETDIVETELVISPENSETFGKSKKSTGDDFGMQLAVTSPKKEELSMDAFGVGSSSHHNETIQNDFAEGSPSSKVKSTESKAVNLQSVVSKEPSEADMKSATKGSQDNADEVISGNLEPVVDSAAGSMETSSSEKLVRKFKITNPKETTLPVTMSVDGEQITLKPDQTYVVSEHDGTVTVTFSRGGSFGFENTTLKNGHYRFSVTRESGWKLSN